MRTELPAPLLETATGQRADAILRACVHCGFCNATCPTYQETGDELDGPRGRIYLIKNLLETAVNDAEGPAVAKRAQRHLDRCLTCRACEVTCPSGVAYGDLLEIGRSAVEPRAPRSLWQRIRRRWLRSQLARPRRVRFWARLGGLFRWALPRSLGRQIPVLGSVPAREPLVAIEDPALRDLRVLLLDGCVQAAATPATNAALERILRRRGAAVMKLPSPHCCGGLALHLSDEVRAHAEARRLLEQLKALPESPDVIVSTASGCGVTQRDYGRWFAGDERADEVAALWAARFVDASELLGRSATLKAARPERRVAFHAPCTLQHGQRLTGLVEPILEQAGYELKAVADSGTCCGSAGTYSMLQPALSGQLKARKQKALKDAGPELVVTANVGCQLHLADGMDSPIFHWLELLE